MQPIDPTLRARTYLVKGTLRSYICLTECYTHNLQDRNKPGRYITTLNLLAKSNYAHLLTKYVLPALHLLDNVLLQSQLRLISGVRSIPVLQQSHVKDTVHSAQSTDGRMHLNRHTAHFGRTELTMPLFRQTGEMYQTTSLHSTRQVVSLRRDSVNVSWPN